MEKLERYLGLAKHADTIAECYCDLKYCCYAPRECKGCEHLTYKVLKE